MALKRNRPPGSAMGFTTPLHRLSEANQLAETRTRTKDDSHRASLDAAWDFFAVRDTAASAEGIANPGMLRTMTQSQQDAEIARRTAGPGLRDSLSAAWDFFAERDAEPIPKPAGPAGAEDPDPRVHQSVAT
jgi:hypothetical protein